MLTIKKEALRYFEMGFSVIPLVYGGKEPLIGWKRYQTERPSRDEVERWFEKDVNIGIVTGKTSGIVVLDIDRTSVDVDVDPGCVVKTGRGIHIYCKYNSCVKSSIVSGVEIKSDGTYVVAPPSLHPSGSLYHWTGRFDVLNLPDPVELIGKFTGLSNLYKGVAEGSRNTSLARLVGSWVRDGLSYEDCMEMATLWNARNVSPLPSKEVASVVKSIYRRQKKVTDVYFRISARFMHYSPFSISRVRERGYVMTHDYGDFELTLKAFETLNQQDNDVFKTIIKFFQIENQRSGVTVQTISTGETSYQVAGLTLPISRIVSMTHSKWSFVCESLERLHSMRLIYRDKKNRTTVMLTPFPNITIDERRSSVSIFLDWDLFRRSVEKQTSVVQNLSRFISLDSNISKALYDFVTVNSSIGRYKEETLFSRLGLNHIESKFARRSLKKAFSDLKSMGVIVDFNYIKNSNGRYFEIKRR